MEALLRIDRELGSDASAQMWVLRGDAIQLSDGTYSPDEAESSYRRAIEMDANASRRTNR